jgi:protein-disulfide isomerase
MQLEATKRGVSVQQLKQDAISAKTTPVTSEQVKAFYEANKNRIHQPLERIAPRIKAYLQRRAQQDQREAFIREVRERYPVTIALRAPRVDVDADNAPFKGPAEAPVTIIEFSDFQCPYCRRVHPTLKRLMHEYQGRVKFVYRNFPLRNIHPQAQKAAEAAQCAAEQDQFWPYHDKLFSTSRLQVDDLKKYAQELGLNTEQFNTCLDTDKYASKIEQDLQAGAKAGVNATPSFFVNGQPVSGAIPYDDFKELIDTALQQSQQAKP